MESVTCPLASVLPWISPASHALLLLLSTHTLALRIKPSITVTVTGVEGVDGLDVAPPVEVGLVLLPPPHAVRAIKVATATLTVAKVKREGDMVILLSG